MQALAIEQIANVPSEELIWEDEVYEEILVRRIRLQCDSTPDRFLFSYNNKWIEEHLKEFLGELRPQILHFFGGYLLGGSPIHAAVDLGIPVLLSLTDYWFFCPKIQLINWERHVCDISPPPVNCLRCNSVEKRRYRWPNQLFPKE